jgi:hypothetical protein
MSITRRDDGELAYITVGETSLTPEQWDELTLRVADYRNELEEEHAGSDESNT